MWNTARLWGWPAKALHWIVAVLMIGLLVVGFYMANFERNMLVQYELTQWHKSFGFTVFVLAALRLAWRWVNPVSPPVPDTAKPWERVAANVTHIAMYALMFVMPVSGWLMASASPLNDEGAYPMQIKNMVFGMFELPDPFAPGDEALEAALHMVHQGSGFLLAALLLLHVGAALKHHVVLKDDVLRRMLPFARVKDES